MSRGAGHAQALGRDQLAEEAGAFALCIKFQGADLAGVGVHALSADCRDWGQVKCKLQLDAVYITDYNKCELPQ